MTDTGELFGKSPQACPFLALELDRDRRSDKPDYRHRCYAEPTPQPRALAHQEAYCLSANFPACPIFEGWAMRAAAQPVPAGGGGGRGASLTGWAAASPSVQPPVQSPAQPALPVDLEPVVPAPGEAWPSEAFPPPEPVDTPRQMAAFDAPVPEGTRTPEAEPEEAAVGLAPIAPLTPTAWTSANPPDAEPDEAPVPGFLAGRSEREPLPPRVGRPDVPFREKVTREDLVPSWDLTSRYGATVNEDRGSGGGGDRFGGLVTAVAVIAILALGVAGVMFLPGLLSGGGHPATPTPPVFASPTVPALASPTLPPGASQTPGATSVPSVAPSTTPGPVASPRLYRIKAGDLLMKIAKRFRVTVADILAANPQITDPNHIIVGQVIVIPQPTATATP